MKTLIIIDCIIAVVTLILAFEIVERARIKFRKDYPTAKLNTTSKKSKIIGIIALIIKALIPIYNLICVIGFLFLTDTMIQESYKQLIENIIED